MLKRGYKLIICVVLVSALFIGFGSAFASAEPAWLTRAKAGIAAAMLASNLVIQPVNYGLDDLIYEGIDPIGYVQNIQETPWELYLEQSVIKVVPDTVYIDGVPYSDIWLGPDAADSLRLAGLDFVSAYNILNNQSEAISYASGYGYGDGVPLYNVDGSITSPRYFFSGSGSTTIGNITTQLTDYNSTLYQGFITLSNGSSKNNYIQKSKVSSNGIYFSVAGSAGNFNAGLRKSIPDGTSPNYLSLALPNSLVEVDPFSFDYTSGIVDAPLDPEDGLLLRIPSEYTNTDRPEYNFNIHDLVNIYPQVTQDHGAPIEIDPDLNPDFETDIDLSNSVGDLIRIILSILDLLDHTTVEFAPEPESPEPGPVDPDPAIPDTPVSDQDGTWLDELLRWIKHAIDVLHQDLEDVLDSIDTQFTEIYNMLEEEFDAIREWMNNVPDVIKRAHAKGMKDAISALKKIVLPLLAPIKALMNLWHYVVEWFNSINAPLLWIFGIMSATSYNLVLPIYASLAGVICIAIYKSFGR